MELDNTQTTTVKDKSQSLIPASQLSFPAIHKFFHRSIVLIRIIGQLKGEKKGD